MKYLLIPVIAMLLFSCKEHPRVDLAKLNFTEKINQVIKYDDKYVGGINTVEAPFALVLEADKPSSFMFNGILIDTADIIFQVRSDKIRKDTSLYDGMGHYSVKHIKNDADLRLVLDHYKADSTIYGYRLSIKPKPLQAAILKELTKLYGPGSKNPTTDHGLYWNLKALHRYVFFAPDYDMLIVLDNTHLSKTCYHDNMNGTIDFGGCNIDQYNADLFK